MLTGATGAANLYIGVSRGAATVGEAFTTSWTGVGAVVALYEGTQTVAQTSAGLIQIKGAVTGETEAANAQADSAIVHTSAAGMVALKGTHGDMDTAAKAAAAEGMVSASATRSIFKSVANMLDTAMNIMTVAKPPPPPAPPRPPTN